MKSLDGKVELIIAVSGGSGSGKSTCARILAEELRPCAVIILSEDDYYNDNGSISGFDPATFNFDDVSTRDHELLASNLHDLKRGIPIEQPSYCFTSHRRKPQTSKVEPHKILIVEGAHILHSAALRSLFDISIFIDAPDDVRLARRVLRDITHRGRTLDGSISQYFKTVKPMHYQYTDPAKLVSDFVLSDGEAYAGESEALVSSSTRRMLAPVLDHIKGRLR